LRRNCILIQVIEGKIKERKGRQGRKRKQLLDCTKEKRGYNKLKEEAVDCTLLRNGFGKDAGLVVRQYTATVHVWELPALFVT